MDREVEEIWNTKEKEENVDTSRHEDVCADITSPVTVYDPWYQDMNPEISTTISQPVPLRSFISTGDPIVRTEVVVISINMCEAWSHTCDSIVGFEIVLVSTAMSQTRHWIERL